MSDAPRPQDMKDAAQALRRAAETLENEAINVKHEGSPEHPEYLETVTEDALDVVNSLNTTE